MVYVSNLKPLIIDSSFALANLPRFAKKLKPALEARPDLVQRLVDATNDRYSASEKVSPFIRTKALFIRYGSYCDDIDVNLRLAEDLLEFAAGTTQGILQELGAHSKVTERWLKRFTKQKKSLQHQVAKIKKLHEVPK